MEMTSTRPYLIRAIYEWIVDNRCTPYLLADATQRGIRVPAQAIKDGQVVLNLAPMAVDRLELGATEVRFNARFSGVSQSVSVPVTAVLAVYAKENGQGMMFPPESEEAPEEVAESADSSPVAPMAAVPTPEPAPVDGGDKPDRPRPSLRIVK